MEKPIVLWNLFTEKKGSQFDRKYVKKYNEDKVNYANSKWHVFKVGIM